MFGVFLTKENSVQCQAAEHTGGSLFGTCVYFALHNFFISVLLLGAPRSVGAGLPGKPLTCTLTHSSMCNRKPLATECLL